ncbi:hypothetical protein EWM64_g8201 [Hericium alpestre]|uniref:Uncharacterized protein n=1 Tax=Hericium alpestre TaxID=135208 RepID=A0A4Y9ZPQ5_9AGAM|nr:hypothetical protein EWM64_g8201 [Hericium alpestre]
MVELIKLSVVAVLYWRARGTPVGSKSEDVVWDAGDEEQPLRDLHSDEESVDTLLNGGVSEKMSRPDTMKVGSTKSVAAILAAGALLAIHAHLVSNSRTLEDVAAIYFVPLLSTIMTAYGVYSLLARPVSQTQFLLIALQLFVRASRDLAALYVIYYYDATLERVLASSAVVFTLIVACFSTDANSLILIIGCIVMAWASVSYVAAQLQGTQEYQDRTELSKTRRTIGIFTFGILILSSVIGAIQLRMAGRLHRPAAESASLFPYRPACHRKPLPVPAVLPYEDRRYHGFDDVLLIVFFSHARYNVNLDYYRMAYAEYFPNMVFVGPGNREDAGFNHSYDVLVDTYKSDEDLTGDPDFYKMAGRMAHHMLYTALREYPCYKGYLWAPFDTFLNVPRLQQFDQNLFWYHSPFAKYVFNPALGHDADNRNATRHPPAAMISPDPSHNLTDGWRGWGPDWWWGDPHVGISECMPAFMKAPEHQRLRLASFTNGKTRFIGGSADTVYIPGRHREAFMDTLALFLETDCFLEIATPTALHMVVPPGENILFVDHWWIWEPPLNATFVRNKWNESMEVDTFHTFHWGDRDAAGVWRGNPVNIRDVSRLLQDSAERQHVQFPRPIP